MKSVSCLAIALGFLAASAQAAILIQEGKPYTFDGYLTIRMGSSTPFTEDLRQNVYLTSMPGGETPRGFVGRQDIRLVNGQLTTSLATLARRYGSETKVTVSGKGARFGSLAVDKLERAGASTPAPVKALVEQVKLTGDTLAIMVLCPPVLQRGALSVKNGPIFETYPGQCSFWVEDNRGAADPSAPMVNIILKVDLAKRLGSKPVSVTVESGDGQSFNVMWGKPNPAN